MKIKFYEKIRNNKKEKNRIFVLFLGSLFLIDYLAFCYHTDKNIFNIFPSIPVSDERKIIDVYVPQLDGKTISKEERSAPQFNDKMRFAAFLFYQVLKGSKFENTTMIAPVNIFIRKIWIYNEERNSKNGVECYIDIEFPVHVDNIKIIKGSEDLFKKAVERTITENIPEIRSVQILVQGIYGRSIWEI